MLTMDAAVVHCTEGIGIWQWPANDKGRAGRGHGLLRRHTNAGNPGCGFHPSHTSARAEIRVVNVVDL